MAPFLPSIDVFSGIACFSFEKQKSSFSKGLPVNSGNMLTNRKRGIALPVLKSFWKIQKLLALSG
jgi:hypothetical protein